MSGKQMLEDTATVATFPMVASRGPSGFLTSLHPDLNGRGEIISSPQQQFGFIAGRDVLVLNPQPKQTR